METKEILEQRGKTYGEFSRNSRIAQELKMCMHDTDGWHHLAADMRESLDMIASKIARILNGDPRHVDSWDDIAGYAKLVADDVRDAKS